MANVLLSAMHMLGMDDESLGDSTGAFPMSVPAGPRSATSHAMTTRVLPLLAALLLAPAAESPVADAAQRGDVEAVRALLREGADVNAAQSDGTSALHWAAVNDDAAVIEVLLYAGANTEATTRLGGYTPLHLAARRGNAVALDALAGGGADVGRLHRHRRDRAPLCGGLRTVRRRRSALRHGSEADAATSTDAQTPADVGHGREPARRHAVAARGRAPTPALTSSRRRLRGGRLARHAGASPARAARLRPAERVA